VRFEAAERNLGFAAGNNRAAALARGHYLVLLNPDTIVTEEWLDRLLRRLRSCESIGMAVPVTNFSGNETKVDFPYRDVDGMHAFAARIAEDRFEQSLEVEVGPLFCALLPRRVWDAAGGLDERFEEGMFEDDDFSRRLRSLNYRIVTAEDCFVHHFGHGSFGRLDPDVQTRIFEQNRRRLEEKWREPWTEHRCRPGVRPLRMEPRFEVEPFLTPERPGRP
jgi:GT2 family glycosyltransferase